MPVEPLMNIALGRAIHTAGQSTMYCVDRTRGYFRTTFGTRQALVGTCTHYVV